jgi:hypothetical protein
MKNTPTTMKAKGLALLPMPRVIERNFGRKGLQSWLETLSPEARAIFSGTIIPNQWYPFHLAMTEPTQSFCRLFYDSDPKGAWALGRFSAEYALRGLFKIFVRIGSPQFIIQKAGAIFHSYYDPCAVQVVDMLARSAFVRITIFPEIDAMIEYRIAGWMEAGLEICGCEQIKIDISQSLTRSDPCSEFHITWSAS